MRFEKTTVGGTVEILASKDFQAIPAKITGAEAVKAGMPVNEVGAAAPAGTGAVGILLYDVDPNENPNCALVVSGIVDWAKCKDHSGATASAETMKSILPAVTFRENIGVNTADTE
ncbi:MAG: hypothetical protein [Caudoviricetes sp.]|nr:MAG: hypothetical protein [Caudoviricetes sp.]